MTKNKGNQERTPIDWNKKSNKTKLGNLVSNLNIDENTAKYYLITSDFSVRRSEMIHYDGLIDNKLKSDEEWYDKKIDELAKILELEENITYEFAYDCAKKGKLNKDTALLVKKCETAIKIIKSQSGENDDQKIRDLAIKYNYDIASCLVELETGNEVNFSDSILSNFSSNPLIIINEIVKLSLSIPINKYVNLDDDNLNNIDKYSYITVNSDHFVRFNKFKSINELIINEFENSKNITIYTFRLLNSQYAIIINNDFMQKKDSGNINHFNKYITQILKNSNNLDNGLAYFGNGIIVNNFNYNL